LSWGTKWLESRADKYTAISAFRAEVQKFHTSTAKNGTINAISAALDLFRATGRDIPLQPTTKKAREVLRLISRREVQRQKHPILGGDFRRSFKAHYVAAGYLAGHKVLKEWVRIRKSGTPSLVIFVSDEGKRLGVKKDAQRVLY
jgi:hypothetical protein